MFEFGNVWTPQRTTPDTSPIVDGEEMYALCSQAHTIRESRCQQSV